MVSLKTRGVWGSIAGIGTAGLALLAGCPGDSDQGTATSCSTAADCASLGAGYLCIANECVPPASGSSSTDPSTSSTTDDESESTAVDTTMTATDPTTATTGPEFIDCDPTMSIFFGEPLVASIEFDFDGMTCRVVSETGTAPQVIFTVEPTGLVRADAEGIELLETSFGQLFNGNQIIDLFIDIPVVVDAGGVSFQFTISSGGPTLADVGAIWG